MTADSPDPVYVTAQLNHPLMRIDRGERYEDPLHDALASHGLGSADGGGTMQLESGEIEFVDLELGRQRGHRGARTAARGGG